MIGLNLDPINRDCRCMYGKTSIEVRKPPPAGVLTAAEGEELKGRRMGSICTSPCAATLFAMRRKLAKNSGYASGSPI